MIQKILCSDCADRSRELFPTPEPYRGEYVKFANGKARGDFICDHCGNHIAIKAECCAFSISTARTPYHPWERGYIKQRRISPMIKFSVYMGEFKKVMVSTTFALALVMLQPLVIPCLGQFLLERGL